MPSISTVGAGKDIYRFLGSQGENVAVLASDGKIKLIDAGGKSLEIRPVKDFIKEVLGVDPPKCGDTDQEVLDILSAALGTCQEINREVNSTKPRPVDTGAAEQETTNMADKKKAPVKAAKAAPKAKVAKTSFKPEDCPQCLCGCGKRVMRPTSTFLPGHDARFHGYIKKYERGERKLNEFNSAQQGWIRSNGIKAGK